MSRHRRALQSPPLPRLKVNGVGRVVILCRRRPARIAPDSLYGSSNLGRERARLFRIGASVGFHGRMPKRSTQRRRRNAESQPDRVTVYPDGSSRFERGSWRDGPGWTRVTVKMCNRPRCQSMIPDRSAGRWCWSGHEQRVSDG